MVVFSSMAVVTLNSYFKVRLEIFRTLLSMRANRQFHLGLPESGILGDTSTGYVFSPVVVCERGKEEEAVQGLTVLSLTRACMAVIRYLNATEEVSVR